VGLYGHLLRLRLPVTTITVTLNKDTISHYEKPHFPTTDHTKMTAEKQGGETYQTYLTFSNLA